MFKNLVGLTIFVSLVLGCSEGSSAPTYELIIAGNPVVLSVHDDPSLIQDDIINTVKPLWEDLENGNSVTFYCKRTLSWDLGEDLQKKAGDDVVVNSQRTISTAVFCFFKNRDGMSGLEQVDEDGGRTDLMHGPNVDWKIIEAVLRGHQFSKDRIRWLIQVEDESEENKARR